MNDVPPEGSNETPPRSHRFPSAHRLKQQRLIRALFDRSRTDVGTVAAGCVRLLYRVVPRSEAGGDVPIQIGFAPGRSRTAVLRNRTKRLMREVYRMHQHVLIDLFSFSGETLTMMVLFRGDPALAQECVARDLPEAMRRAASRLERQGAPGGSNS